MPRMHQHGNLIDIKEGVCGAAREVLELLAVVACRIEHADEIADDTPSVPGHEHEVAHADQAFQLAFIKRRDVWHRRAVDREDRCEVRRNRSACREGHTLSDRIRSYAVRAMPRCPRSTTEIRLPD